MGTAMGKTVGISWEFFVGKLRPFRGKVSWESVMGTAMGTPSRTCENPSWEWGSCGTWEAGGGKAQGKGPWEKPWERTVGKTVGISPWESMGISVGKHGNFRVGSFLSLQRLYFLMILELRHSY